MYVGYVWKMMMQHMIDDGLVEKLLGEWRKSNLLDRGKLPKTWEAYFQKARADLLDALPPELQEPFAAWDAERISALRQDGNGDPAQITDPEEQAEENELEYLRSAARSAILDAAQAACAV